MKRQCYLDFNAFEKQEQIEEYLAAIKQRKFPLKYAYTGRAAYTHDKLVRSQEYGLAYTEAALIQNRFASSILPKLTGIGLNVIDVGSGNGIKALVVLKLLHQKFSNLRYVGLDYSKELLNIAVTNISKKNPMLDIFTYQIDFEINHFREIIKKVQKETGYSNLFLFLGHTLGNVNPIRTLLNIRNSMGIRDTLLAGVELYQPDKVDYTIKHYRNEPFYNAVFNLLTFAGFERGDGTIDVSFNELKKDVEVYFQFTKDISVQISLCEAIEFKKGERLLIFFSHRFNEMEIGEIFRLAGLNVLDIMFDNDHVYAIIYACV